MQYLFKLKDWKIYLSLAVISFISTFRKHTLVTHVERDFKIVKSIPRAGNFDEIDNTREKHSEARFLVIQNTHIMRIKTKNAASIRALSFRMHPRKFERLSLVAPRACAESGARDHLQTDAREQMQHGRRTCRGGKLRPRIHLSASQKSWRLQKEISEVSLLRYFPSFRLIFFFCFMREEWL